MTHRPTRLLAAAAAVAALLVPASPAAAVTNGWADQERHPYVGMFYGEFRPDVAGLDPGCNGTLIAPTVFLTAAHCLAGRPNRLSTPLYVTFDPVFRGGASAGHRVVDRVWDLRYGHDLGDPHDLAVLLLEDAVEGITPAELPPAGALDGRDLRGGTFDLVGYGPDPGAGRDGGERWTTVSGFQALTSAELLLNAQDARGFGGGCGDSGGPYLPHGTRTVVALFHYGDARCEAHNRGYRLDTEAARTFLARFVELP